MNNFKGLGILVIFGAAFQIVELIAKRNDHWKSTRYKIFIDQEKIDDNYESLLSQLAKNRSTNYETDVVLSSRGCHLCGKILGVLMKASSQSFLTIDDFSFSNYSDVDPDGTIPAEGYYKSVLILTENILEFSRHFKNLRSSYAWNPRARHLIFTAEEPENDELEMIFAECWLHKVLNVGVIVKNRKEGFTYNPYFKNDRLQMSEKVDWSRLFYDKLRNMNGFLIRIKFIPFSSNSVKKWILEGNKLKFFGSDFGYAEVLCKTVNATPEYIDLTPDTIDLLWTYTYRYQLWNEPKLRSADIWMNAMSIGNKMEERFERTYPIHQSSLGILVPKSKRKAPSIFVPYNHFTWTSLVVTLITFTLYSSLLYNMRGINDNAFFRTLGIFFGKNLEKRRHGIVEKFTFLIFTMFSLLIISAYQGELYGALTAVSYYPEIDTMSELCQRIKKINSFAALAQLLRSYENTSVQVVPFGSGDYIEYMRTHPRDAHVLPDDAAQYDVQRKVLSKHGVPFFHVMREYLQPGFHVIVLRYGSPYFEKLERILLACREAGLVEYWKAESKFQDLWLGTIITPDAAEENTLKKLSLQTQLTGFYILGTGLLASTFSFAAEILVQKYQKKKNNLSNDLQSQSS